MRLKTAHQFALAACLLACIVWAAQAWGQLNDPGLSEDDIRRVWATFEATREKIEIRGDYPFQSCFQEAAREHGIPLPLLVSIARGESNFDHRAGSLKDCLGVMQIHWPKTARALGFHRREDLFDACRNIEAGTRYLAMLLDRYRGDTFLALAAYNYGPGRVSEEHVPRGAQLYAAYIHDHLTQLCMEERLGMQVHPRSASCEPSRAVGLQLKTHPFR